MVGLIKFASKKEAARARALDDLAAAGQVQAWWAHFPIYCGIDQENGAPRRMFVDFKVRWADGTITYEDTKGAKPTADWRLKRDAVRAARGIEITIL